MLTALILGITALLLSKHSDVRPIDDEEYEIDIHQRALENPELVGGDMLIPQGTDLGNGIADEKYRWPGYPGGCTVPYIIDKSVVSQKALIDEAIKYYHDNTCVKFKVRTNEKEYVKIFKGNGCYAQIGRNKTAAQPQVVSLGMGCYKLGTVIHELGHVLGFYHEQNRSDRDTYLTINIQNVRAGMQGNFKKLLPNENLLLNNFDYDSIMIYGDYAFSKRPNVLKTMEAKNGQTLLNPYAKTKMTDSDIERVKLLYKCP